MSDLRKLLAEGEKGSAAAKDRWLEGWPSMGVRLGLVLGFGRWKAARVWLGSYLGLGFKVLMGLGLEVSRLGLRGLGLVGFRFDGV